LDSQVCEVFPAVKDSFLRLSNPNVNEGGNPRLIIAASGARRILVGFDLYGINPTSVIDSSSVISATLVMTIAENADNWGPGRLVSAYPLQDDFTEGSGAHLGLPPSEATPGYGPGVTWNCPADTNVANVVADCPAKWNGGGTFGPASDSVLHTNGLLGDVSWDVTADVQNGTSAWLIKKDTESLGGQARYYSREGSLEEFQTLDFAPRLIVFFGTPEE
jgi:hypothetical protein